MAFSSRGVYPDTSVPLGTYGRHSPLVFSLVPRGQRRYGSAKKLWIASRWANRSCSAISFPRSSVKVLRRGVGTGCSFFVTPSRALVASVPSILARMTRRVVRSTRVPTAEPWRAPFDEVTRPVPGHRAGCHLGRAFRNRRPGGERAASIRAPRPRPTGRARLTQRRQPCAAQGSAGQHRQAPIEGLRREVLVPVVRIRASEASGNLLRRTAVSQVGLDILPQPGVQELARSPWLTGLANVCAVQAR